MKLEVTKPTASKPIPDGYGNVIGNPSRAAQPSVNPMAGLLCSAPLVL